MKNKFRNGVMMMGDIAFLQAGAAVRFTSPTLAIVPGSTNAAAENASTDAEHSAGKVEVVSFGAERNVSFATWGSNNRYPTDIMAEVNKNGILKAGISTRRDAHYGTGPMYYRLVAKGDTEVVTPLSMAEVPPEVTAFHRRVQMEQVLKRGISDWEWWGWCAHEYVLNNAQSRVVSMRPLRAAWLRWALMNDDGVIEWVLHCPNWGQSNLGRVDILPVADPWWSPEEVQQWARENGFYKFVRPSIMPDPQEGYYPKKDWHAVYENKWLQNTNAIPASRAALLENSINIKYLIKYPQTYLERKFKDTWADMTDTDREEKRREMLTLMNDWLSGKENAGKAFVAEYGVTEEDKAEPSWEIQAIDSKMSESSGASIADSEKGNSEILATLRVDPTLLGQGAPGGKLGAGSGSDKAEAIRILHALMYGDREQTTDCWYFVRDFNAWDQELFMGYRPMELNPQTTTAERPAANAS